MLVLSNVCFSEQCMASEPLPLSSQEITKLQHLFSSGSNSSLGTQEIMPHEHVVWDQTPINIILPVSKERMVSFPMSVEFGYDKSILSDDKLQVQNNNGTLYFLAKSTFASQRVQVKCSDTGQIILLNLSAQKEASNTPLDIVVSSGKKVEEQQLDKAQSVNDENTLPKPEMSPVSLTRFAVQQLYAPKRLLSQSPDIFRTPMHTAKTVPLVLDSSVIAMPLASWRSGDLFVTAVLLRNQLHQPLTLDPRNICGNWQTATFFPSNNLAATSSSADSTTAFLISNRPFADSVQICTRGF